MRILVVSQIVDKNDLVLGFFHRWVEVISTKFDFTTVICLKKGRVELGEKIKLLSLGKEDGVSKFEYVLRFYKYIWGERKNYDIVFVHMNEEYVLLAGIFWRLFGKKVIMWRNHPANSWKTYIAVFLANITMCTSKFSFVSRFSKNIIMPVGIDTSHFTANTSVERNEKQILSLGRISPIKGPHVLIEALKLLKKRGVLFNALIVGNPLPKDEEYYESLKKAVIESDLHVKFMTNVGMSESPKIYSQSSIFVNLSPDGMYDKTIFESMSCGALPVVSNKNLEGIVHEKLLVNNRNPEEVAERLEFALSLNSQERKELQDKYKLYVSEEHSLNTLVNKISLYANDR